MGLARDPGRLIETILCGVLDLIAGREFGQRHLTLLAIDCDGVERLAGQSLARFRAWLVCRLYNRSLRLAFRRRLFSGVWRRDI